MGKATHIAYLLTCSSMARSWVSEESPFVDIQETHRHVTGEVAAASYTFFCSAYARGQDCYQGGHGSGYLRLQPATTAWARVTAVSVMSWQGSALPRQHSAEETGP